MSTPADTTTAVCPHCGAKLVPIVYGFPAPDAFEQVARGEIVLGGCLMYPGAPDDGCPTKGCAGPDLPGHSS